jgi:hypothetical protein
MAFLGSRMSKASPDIAVGSVMLGYFDEDYFVDYDTSEVYEPLTEMVMEMAWVPPSLVNQ